MSEFFVSGRAVDVVLLLMSVEAGALAAIRGVTGRGPGLGAMTVNLLAGASLLAALRLALTGAAWPWIAAALAAAFIAHLADLGGRFAGPAARSLASQPSTEASGPAA